MFIQSRSIMFRLEARKKHYKIARSFYSSSRQHSVIFNFYIKQQLERHIYFFFYFDINLFKCTRPTKISEIGLLPVELLCLLELAALPVGLVQL